MWHLPRLWQPIGLALLIDHHVEVHVGVIVSTVFPFLVGRAEFVDADRTAHRTGLSRLWFMSVKIVFGRRRR
jgi:hypothetical protein